MADGADEPEREFDLPYCEWLFTFIGSSSFEEPLI